MSDLAQKGPKVPDPRKTGNSGPKINGLQAEINHFGKSGYPGETRQRTRTVKTAIQSLDAAVKLPALKRRQAIERLRNARQPIREVRQIVLSYSREAARGSDVEAVELFDAQALRVKLIRRDLGIWPPQSTSLAELERRIIDGITRAEFDELAAKIWAIPQALPETFRKLESRGA